MVLSSVLFLPVHPAYTLLVVMVGWALFRMAILVAGSMWRSSGMYNRSSTSASRCPS